MKALKTEDIKPTIVSGFDLFLNKGSSNAVLSCGFSIADFINAFLQVVAIVVSAQSSISLHFANNIGS